MGTGHQFPPSALYWVPQGAVLRVAWNRSSLSAPCSDAHGWRIPLLQHLIVAFSLGLLPPHRCSVTDPPSWVLCSGASSLFTCLPCPSPHAEGCGEVCWRRQLSPEGGGWAERRDAGQSGSGQALRRGFTSSEGAGLVCLEQKLTPTEREEAPACEGAPCVITS